MKQKTVAGLVVACLRVCFARPTSMAGIGLSQVDSEPFIEKRNDLGNPTKYDITQGINLSVSSDTGQKEQLEKRIVVRAMNDCSIGPGGQLRAYPYPSFITSRCGRTTPQAVEIYCERLASENRAGSVEQIDEHCNPDELCIDGVSDTSNEGRLTAFCTSGVIQRPVDARPLSGLRTRSYLTLTAPITQQAVEVVMTGSNITDSISVQSLSIDAVGSAGSINNVPINGGLTKGHKECEQCSSLVLSPLPQGTTQLRAKAIFNGAYREANFVWATL